MINRRRSLKSRLPTIFLADLALLFVAIIWGASYAVAKETLNSTDIANLILFRFFIALMVLFPLVYKDLTFTSRNDLCRGIILGIILSAIFFAETYGVMYTSATNAALIIALCILFTPILEASSKHRFPSSQILLYALIALVGTGMLVWERGAGFSFNSGDIVILLAAILRALMVVATKQLTTGRDISSGSLTFIQLSVVTSVAAVAVLAKQGLPGFVPPANPSFWVGLLFLALFCTLGAFFIQNWAVRKTSPTRVGFLMGTEPIFGMMFAVLLLGEKVQMIDGFGSALLLLGIYLGIKKLNK